MKPRIFLFDGSQNFLGRMLFDLKSLRDTAIGQMQNQFLLHIGFNAPSSDAIRSTLEKLPTALYCTRSFKDGWPGEEWDFSEEIESGPSSLGVYAIIKAPVNHYNLSLEAQKEIEKLVSKNEVSATKKKSVEDLHLQDFEWSVRTTNVFKNEQIKKLSDLLRYSTRDLLALKNFGRLSLAEVESFLSTYDIRLPEHHLDDPLSNIEFTEFTEELFELEQNDNFFDCVKLAFKKIDDERIQGYLLDRSGIRAKKTLEELGIQEGVTRERIRQLEAKGLEKVFNQKPNYFRLFYERVQEIVSSSPVALRFEDLSNIDSRFGSGERDRDLLHYVMHYCRKALKASELMELYLVKHESSFYILPLDSDNMHELRVSLIHTLQESESMALADLLSGIKDKMPSSHGIAIDLLFEDLIQNCLIEKKDEAEIFIKYVGWSTIERAAQFLLREIKNSEVPLRRTELEQLISNSNYSISFSSVHNALISSDEVYPSSHGSWGTIEHFNFSELDKAKILNCAKILCERDKNIQFHSREIIQKLNGQVDLAIDEFGAAAVLRKYGKFNYLGRNIFTGLDSEIERRMFINETLVKVLREAGRPIHISTLLEEARKYVSIGEHAILQFKKPVINLGAATFALDYWDEDVLRGGVDIPYGSLTKNEMMVMEKLVFSYGKDNEINLSDAYDTCCELFMGYTESSKLAAVKRVFERFQKDELIQINSDTIIIK